MIEHNTDRAILAHNISTQISKTSQTEKYRKLKKAIPAAHMYVQCTTYTVKDIVSMRVEHGHIPVSGSKVIYWITIAIKEGGLGRHD